MLLQDIALITLSAVLYALALPNEIFNYGNPVIGMIALVPFFFVLYRAKSIGSSILRGVWFGFLSTVLVYFWLLFFQDFSVWTLSGVTAAHILYFIFLSPFIYTAGKLPSRIRPFVAAGIWISYEYLKSTGYLALPWGLLAHTSGTFLSLIQVSDITGQWGVSFLIAAVNASVTELLLYRGARSRFPESGAAAAAAFTVFILVLSLGYGFYSLGRTFPVKTSFDAVLVQQDADSWISGNEMESIRKGQILTREALKSSGKKPDIVIWSENAFRFPYTEDGIRYKNHPKDDPFSDFLKEIDTPIFIGSPYILDPSTYSALNAVMLISPEGKILQYYGKTHPVPFAENIPFWNIPFVQSFFRNVLGLESEGWTIGKPDVIFSIRNSGGTEITFGAPICFEDSFPSIARSFFRSGADILINLSNDSWSKTVSGETQHYMAAKFRSVENRRTMIRSTNAGVTAVIDPYGIPHSMLPLFVSKAETVSVPVYGCGSYTFYTLFGDWFPVAAILVLIIFRIYSLRSEKKRHFPDM